MNEEDNDELVEATTPGQAEQPQAPAEHPDPQAEHSPQASIEGWFNRRPRDTRPRNKRR